MDPTKSFDHLDPKLKDTYARVMGTDTNGSAAPPAAPASPLSSSPDPLAQAQPATDPAMNQAGSMLNTSPTPDGATADPSAQLSPPLASAPASPDANAAPAMSSFFSNPSPAATETPPQAYGENGSALGTDQAASPTLVTPYTPGDPVTNPNATPAPETMVQPLPSPSTVGQTAPHETSALLKVLYIVGSVIFFAIYTIFWIKVFNLPFLF